MGAKPGANYAAICVRIRERTQKIPKIEPTREIVPFCPKNEEKYTERWSRRKKEMLNPVFVVVPLKL